VAENVATKGQTKVENFQQLESREAEVENGLQVVFNICDGVLDRPRHLRLPLETLL
jgi:hypothetical protein